MQNPFSEDEARVFLAGLCSSAEAIDAVLRYTQNPFALDRLPVPPYFPMPDEPHVAVWREYAVASEGMVFEFLRERLPQLCIPVRKGRSLEPEYARVMYEGAAFDERAFGGTLALKAPEKLKLEIIPHFTGSVPALITDDADDFRVLYQALCCKSEPVSLEPAVHAMTVSGLLNWDRIKRLQKNWMDNGGIERLWPAELSRIAREERPQIQDTVMLLRTGGYSGVSPEMAGLDTPIAAWPDVSMALRKEHECTHIATRRLYGLMRNNLLDELIADCMAMVAVLGCFKASGFLAFMGAPNGVLLQGSARIKHYTAGLDGDAFTLLLEVLVRAAKSLELLSMEHLTQYGPKLFFMALTRMTLPGLAAPGFEARFAETAAWFKGKVEAAS